MQIFQSAALWGVVAALYVLMRLEWPGSRSLRFGALNLCALFVIFGSSVAFFAGTLALGIWGALRLGKDFPGRGRQWFALGALLVLFGGWLFYKVWFGVRTELAVPPVRAVQAFALMQAAGFSYIVLRAIDLVRSITWGRAPLLDPLSLCGYLAPFNMILAGPIGPYSDHCDLMRLPMTPSTFGELVEGVFQITTGLTMSVVVAQSMRLFVFGVSGVVGSRTWFGMAYLTVYLYFDFAGYSLVALGIGRLVGVPTPPNFRLPFLASSLTEFWTRWHISLGTFVRANLFIPAQIALARRFRSKRQQLVVSSVPLTLTFGLVGLWHRVSVRYALWGLGFAALILTEKYVRSFTARAFQSSRGLRIAWSIAGPIYVFAAVVASLRFVEGEMFNVSNIAP